MDTKVAFRVLACGLILVALLRLGLRDAAPVATPGDEGATGVVEGDVEPELAVEELALDKPSVPSKREARVDLEPQVDSGTSTDGLARIVGCFENLEGAPLAGVALDFHGWGRNSNSKTSPDWKDIETASGPDGCFELAFDPPEGYQFALDARLEGYAGLGWRWFEFEPGSTLDLGAVPLPPESVVAGVVRRKDGREIGSGWRVRFESDFSNGGPGADVFFGVCAVDPITGAFEAAGIPPGPLDIEAKHRDLGYYAGPDLVVTAGTREEIEILVDPADLDQILDVQLRFPPFRTFHALTEFTVRCVQESDVNQVQVETVEGTNHARFEGLRPSTYRVDVECDLFEPWSLGGIRPGDRVVANLVGAAGVELELTSTMGGDEIEAYALRVRYPGANFSPNEFEWHRFKDPRPEDGIHRGLPVHDAMLIVDAPGYAHAEVALEGIVRGEIRPIKLELELPGSLDVSVVDDGGRPVPGAKLTLYPDVEGFEPGTYSHTLPHADREALEARALTGESDGSGVHRFEEVGTGPHTLRGILGSDVRYEWGLSLEGGEHAEIRMELPSRRPLRGILLGPPGARFDGMLVRALPTRLDEEPAEVFRLSLIGALPQIRVEPNGEFLLEGLAPETYRVLLHLPDFESLAGHGAANLDEGTAHPLGTVDLGVVVEGPVEFDVSGIFPGRLDVALRHAGEPAAGWSVMARRADVEEPWVVHGRGTPNAHGVVRLGPLLAGEYRLRVSSLEERWTHWLDASFEVPPNGEASAEVNLETARGRVRILSEATGEPLSSTMIRIGDAGFRTDGEGWLELELPLGEHGVRGPVYAEPGQVREPDGILSWGVNGSSVEELRVPDA